MKRLFIIKKRSVARIGWRVLVISLVVVLAWPDMTMAGPPENEYIPPSGKGPIVILLSGASGPDRYRSYAAEVARFGYYAILLDGNNVHPAERPISAEGFFRRAIEEAQRSPSALPGKAAVIGLSMGGYGALAYAAQMPDLVSAVIAYYPRTMDVSDMRSFASKFKVPILVLAGEKDDYMKCCMIGSMRAMEGAAKQAAASFELVAYPNAGHMFNLRIEGFYKAKEAADAWQRTQKMLGKYQPLP